VISQRIDALFRNSLAETLTETEKAFQLSFVSMSEAILVAMQAVSLHHRGDHHGGDGQHHDHDRARAAGRIRHAEGAGLSPGLRGALLFGESLLIALHRRPGGMLLTLPLAAAFARPAGTLFPVFRCRARRWRCSLRAALLVGVVAAAWPAWKMSRIDIVAGLRHVG
jgi:putative ABC transport system permease protein